MFLYAFSFPRIFCFCFLLFHSNFSFFFSQALPEWANYPNGSPSKNVLDLVDLIFNPVRKKKAVADLGK